MLFWISRHNFKNDSLPITCPLRSHGSTNLSPATCHVLYLFLIGASRPFLVTASCSINFLGFERNDRRCLALGTARPSHERTYPLRIRLPRKSIKLRSSTSGFCLFVFSFPLTLNRSILVHYPLQQILDCRTTMSVRPTDGVSVLIR